MRGEHWAILGPNGSGKSLIARAIAGRIPIVRGEIEFGFEPQPGRTIEDSIALVSFEQSHEIGLDGVPASRWFTLEHDEMPTVANFLSRERIEEINPFQVGGQPMRSAAAFARDRKKILRMLRIEDLLDRDLLALSNGERRKILIARALLKNPKLLILDDPFIGLDAESRKHFSHVIDELIRDGKIHVLLISTRPDELPRGITNVIRVANCRVVGTGLPRDASRREASPTRTRLRSAATTSTSGGSSEIIRLNDVSVRYGKKTILKNLSWVVRRGESWAILGPNGSGKTTLLSLITGENPQAYANEVFVFGQRRGDGNSIWDFRSRIGVVSPDVHLSCDTELTCEQIVVTGFDDPDGLGPTRPQVRAARAWLAKLGLKKFSRTTFGAMSPGNQRMALLARALAKNPDLLVLDEPCQGLDESHRRDFVRAVEKVMTTSEITVLYVTHHQDEIPRGISRRLRMGM